jgi:hypothetical protein
MLGKLGRCIGGPLLSADTLVLLRKTLKQAEKQIIDLLFFGELI